jgi:GntR family transcriptional regulator
MTMSAKVDRNSPLPFYFQLKQIILAEIAAKNLQPGDRFVGDHELCAMYDVSRTVVRQALSELEAEGVVDRVKGRGTFIAHPKVDEGLVRSLTGLYQDVKERGSTVRSDVRRIEVVAADAAVAAALQLTPGTPVVVIERLRFVDGEPWVLVITHVPADIAPGLADEDLSEQSLYELLESKYLVKITRGKRTVEASVASAALARSLGISPGDAILLLRSVVFGADNLPLETFVAYHRGDRSRFEVELGTVPGEEPQPMRVLTTRT